MGRFEVVWKRHLLHFTFEAKTSRDTLHVRPVWFILVKENNLLVAVGECAWLNGLSPEKESELEPRLQEVCSNFNEYLTRPDLLKSWPSLQMAMDMIRAQLNSKQLFNPFPGTFSQGGTEIPINGLVWMGDKDSMLNSIRTKISEGYKCVKLKIGGIDFNDELRILEYIRKDFDENAIEIRLDANGAFEKNKARLKLESLAKFGIHSIEQPIKQGQWNEMANLISYSPIPIALDEELIGITEKDEREKMLEDLKPDYIILKPSLIGGFTSSKEWIDFANKFGIKWWLTSMLESNIALNALCQWVSTQDTGNLPQGLGTGKLYSNNIDCGLNTSGGFIRFNPEVKWDIRNIDK